MRHDFSNRVVMVTGGASGIGRAIAMLAGQSGARVAVVDSSEANAKSTVAALQGAGAQAMAEVFDVRDGKAAIAAVKRIEQTLGPIDGLVAAAGVSPPHPAASMPEEIWSLAIDVNLTGMFLSVQAVGRRMIERGRGAIVTVASIAGVSGHPGRTHYSASKHGIIGMTKSLAIEWGRFGVRVNAVAPGPVYTPLFERNIPPEHIRDVMQDRIPAGRLATAEDQAHPCLFLLSDEAAYINGITLPVDGGMSAGFMTHWNGADLGSKAMLERGLYSAPTTADSESTPLNKPSK
jgi:NAD(P)-dependent dehydrogenase (short-subunit alcohol dehydrogenase family)